MNTKTKTPFLYPLLLCLSIVFTQNNARADFPLDSEKIDQQVEQLNNSFTPKSSSYYAKQPIQIQDDDFSTNFQKPQETKVEKNNAQKSQIKPMQTNVKTNAKVFIDGAPINKAANKSSAHTEKQTKLDSNMQAENEKPEKQNTLSLDKQNIEEQSISTKQSASTQIQPKILFSTNKTFQELKSLDFAQEWSISGFNLPESTTSRLDSSWIYVSNVNKSDDSGFISRIKKDGSEIDMNWIKGLTQPTGMLMQGKKLFVASQEKVYVIDSTRGKVSDTIKPKNNKIKNINSIAISEEGTLFASEVTSGIILKQDRGQFIEWFQSDLIRYPNAIAVKGNKLYIATYGSTLSKDLTPAAYGSIYAIDLFTRNIELINSSYRLGPLESMQVYENGLIVTSSKGQIYYIDENNRILLLSISDGITDAYISGDMLYVVFLKHNRLTAYKINKK